MIVSMTGFARSESPVSGGTLVCELRSVNHRFLEAALRLPEELRSLEGELRALLQKELRRGKVDAIFTYRSATEAERSLTLDRDLVDRLAPLLGELAAASQKAPGVQLQVNLADLLRFPGVLREASSDPEALPRAARALFAKSLADIKSMRASEGSRLKQHIEQRCAQLEQLVADVHARMPEVRAAMRARFNERLAELAVTVDAERLEQEIALLLQRIDVDEELDRLVGHIAETRKVIASPEAAGRRLDFLMQEFNREANTLCSKSTDIALTRTGLALKAVIDQFREQSQNVE